MELSSKKVPLVSLFGKHISIINSNFVNMGFDLKNCYLLTNSDFNEDCMYGSRIASKTV